MVIIEEVSHPWTYDVFLSFRGEDTRNNFTGHLYSALRQNGINTFMDDQLKRGEKISPALLQAIEESKISIIVFSRNYASSRWCLDELVKILDCKKSNQQEVRSVFYKVDPSDIRNHRGSFGEALANHECKFKDNPDEVQKWKIALSEAANLSGWPLLDEHCSESSVIHKIVEEISKQVINSTKLDVAAYPVGIEPRVQEIHKLLGVEGRDVHMVGIWGAGGIGKTTIAKAVYNSIAHEFDGSCFLENVREKSMSAEGFVNLQRKLLCEILGNLVEVPSIARGITMIKDRLRSKKVLLVLDDVNDMAQLINLARDSSWFGMGSKIIITTRDKQLLALHNVDFDLIYEVKELNHDEALDLFSMNAFKRNRPLDGYAELTELAMRYAKGLPLALTILGSSLCNESVEQWEAALGGFKSSKIQDVLKISYNGLDHRVKEAFLDIACFFKGENREHVIKILEAFGSKKHDIDVLIEKALISIRHGDYIRMHGDCIWMHDLVEEMGRDIVHELSPNNPGKRSRLWFHEDVYRVLTENIGTAKVIGIKVQLPEDSDVIYLSGTTFSNMPNLRLFIHRSGRYAGVVDNLPNSLRVLDWPDCDLQFLPSNSFPRKLAVINMPTSCITGLGVGYKPLKNLTSINLSYCQYLTKVFDLSGSPNLQRLDLSHCENLVEVDHSVGFLDKLDYLSLWGCSRLETFPTEVSWKSMRELSLGICKRLENFINSVHKMESINILRLSGSGIKELHSCIGRCTTLEVLDLEYGTSIKQFPSSIGNLTSLVKLDASETLIEELPSSIEFLTSLQTLDVSKTPLKELPASIGNLTSLRTLDASETLIGELPLSIENLNLLEYLRLSGCANLTNAPLSVYGGLQHLGYLNLSWCPKLVTFPSRASALVSSSAESLPPMLPTNSNNGHDHPGSSLFPQLRWLDFEGCKLSVSDFLTNLDCASTLQTLNLSGSSFDSLPACISKFRNLSSLDLRGCMRLRDISELPPNIGEIKLDDCVSLERVSKLSNILEQKDTAGLLQRMEENSQDDVDEDLNLRVEEFSKKSNARVLRDAPSFTDLNWLGIEANLNLKIAESLLKSVEVEDPHSSSEISLPDSLDVEKINQDLEGNVHADEKYESLPGELKRLFLYCLVLPSHYEFRKEELVQMWIAEGVIRDNQRERMEDIGSEYFTSLHQKGFFVTSRCDFRVDFDSIVSMSIYNPGNFLYKVNPTKLSHFRDENGPNYHVVAADGKLDGALEITRHLSLIGKEIDEITFGDLKKFKHLRTLLLLAGSGSFIKQVPRDFFLSSKELRTLNLSAALISELPSSIQCAKSLRYLDLSNTPLTRLPESIDSLQSLQTIKLRGCDNFLQLPKGMKKLINLRHMDLDIIRQLRSMPPHLGNLTDLQTLSAFIVGRDDGCRIQELKNLKHLRGVLRISRLENVWSEEEAKKAALIDKKGLQRLDLRWSNVFTENMEKQEKILECLQPHAGVKELQIQHYAGSKLPTWISNPCFAELLVLTLYKCRNCELLPSIGQLPMLKSLTIIEMNKVKQIDHRFFSKRRPVDQAFHAFPKLEILQVDTMLNLKEWKDANIGDLPSLLKLTVDSCPELDTLPSLSCLKSLKYLEFRCCPKLLTLPPDGLPTSLESFIVIDCPELKEWCRKAKGEDRSNIYHVPSIWFDSEEASQKQV